jgi:CrcB protein
MIKHLLLVFIGGGVGSCLRYLVALQWNSEQIKWIPTLLVNVVGCVLLGGLIALHHKNEIGNYWYLILAIGFCGGFTTFSTFSAELYLLLKQGSTLQALLYLAASSVLGITAVFLSYKTVETLVR